MPNILNVESSDLHSWSSLETLTVFLGPCRCPSISHDMYCGGGSGMMPHTDWPYPDAESVCVCVCGVVLQATM